MDEDITLDPPSFDDSEEELDEEATALQRLSLALDKEVERAVIEIPVPSRPGVAVRFKPDVTQKDLRKWQKQAGVNKKEGIDGVRFSAIVVGQTCVGIYVDDELVTNEDGVALNFASPTILEMTGESNALTGIQKFWGVDPHLESAALKVLEYAGYGEDVDAIENPTQT